MSEVSQGRCPRCGAPLAPGSNVCSSCGWCLPAEPSGAAEGAASYDGASAQNVPEGRPSSGVAREAGVSSQPSDSQKTTLLGEEGGVGEGVSSRRGSPGAGYQTTAMPHEYADPTQYVPPQAPSPERTVLRGSYPRQEAASGARPDRTLRADEGAGPARSGGGYGGGMPTRGQAVSWMRRQAHRAAEALDRSPDPYGKLRKPQGRLAMPKLAALVAGAVCLVCGLQPWLSYVVGAQQVGAIVAAELGPVSLLVQCFQLLAKDLAQLSSLAATSSALEPLLDMLPVLAVGALGVLRIVALVMLAVGLVRTLMDPSPWEYWSLSRALRWNVAVPAAWVVGLGILRRVLLGVGTTSAKAATASLVLGLSDASNAWLCLCAAVAGMVVAWAWTRAHQY
ncbi:MAG: zinc ribbon domain-containing protein [Atopobiaceae bacterium]